MFGVSEYYYVEIAKKKRAFCTAAGQRGRVRLSCPVRLYAHRRSAVSGKHVPGNVGFCKRRDGIGIGGGSYDRPDQFSDFRTCTGSRCHRKYRSADDGACFILFACSYLLCKFYDNGRRRRRDDDNGGYNRNDYA